MPDRLLQEVALPERLSARAREAVGGPLKLAETEAELLLDCEPVTEPELEPELEAVLLCLMEPEPEMEPLEHRVGEPVWLPELLQHMLQLLLAVREAL